MVKAAQEAKLRASYQVHRDYEAWEAWAKVSTKFLFSLPDDIRQMEDPIVQVASTAYLG